jgi:hypothetical protein
MKALKAQHIIYVRDHEKKVIIEKESSCKLGGSNALVSSWDELRIFRLKDD